MKKSTTMLPLITAFTRQVRRRGIKAKLKKESFKWENFFGKQPLMYKMWLEPSDTSFHQNGKDLTL